MKQKTIQSIIIILIFILFAGFVISKADKKSVIFKKDYSVTVLQKDSKNRPVVQTRITDQTCTKVGSQDVNQYFEIIRYEELQSGKDVKIVVSCDSKSYTLSGSVNQVIPFMHPDIDSREVEAVSLDTDFNFDGYNDFEVTRILSDGEDDPNAIYIADVYLYDPVNMQLVYNKQLSDFKNIWVDTEKKYVQEYSSYDNLKSEHIETVQNYTWQNSQLVKVKE